MRNSSKMNFPLEYFANVAILFVAVHVLTSQGAKKKQEIQHFTERDVIQGMKICFDEQRIAVSPSNSEIFDQLSTNTKLNSKFKNCLQQNLKNTIHPTKHLKEFCTIFDKALECFVNETTSVQQEKGKNNGTFVDTLHRCVDSGKVLYTYQRKEFIESLTSNKTSMVKLERCLKLNENELKFRGSDLDKFCRAMNQVFDCATTETSVPKEDAKKGNFDEAFNLNFWRCFRMSKTSYTPKRQEFLQNIFTNKTCMHKFESCLILHANGLQDWDSDFDAFCRVVDKVMVCALGDKATRREKTTKPSVSKSETLGEKKHRCFLEKKIQITPAIVKIMKKNRKGSDEWAILQKCEQDDENFAQEMNFVKFCHSFKNILMCGIAELNRTGG